MKPDCLVVGAGLIGLLTAHELASAGWRVTVLEKSRPARESSWAGGGILSPLYPWRYPDAVNALAAQSQRHYPAFCQQLHEATGIDPQWVPSGLLITDIDDAARVERWAAQYATAFEWLDPAQAQAIEPQLGIRPARSAWLPEVAQVRNPRLTQSLLAAVERLGVEVVSDCEVHDWKIQGERVQAASTARGDYAADHYLVASGAWSGQLLQRTGLALPIEPVRGQMLLFKGPPGLLHPITLHAGRYAIPRRDGHVLFGSTMEHTGFEKQTTDEARQDLSQAAFALLPALAELPVVAHWAGLRPGSPDGTPLIGPHPRLSNLFINAGHFRNGVVLGLASARLLADRLLERTPALDADPYLPDKYMKEVGG